jgi:radical SAM superfamily enzyme YgiQ (UPF0313 family)
MEGSVIEPERKTGTPPSVSRGSAAGDGRMQSTGARLKVVLYNPQAVFFTMPLALLAVGSALDPEKYEIVIVDGRLDADPVAALRPHLEDALCLGVTVLTGAPISDALMVSRAAKQVRPALPVIWGGWHPSMFARECLAEPSVDVSVQGQGEETFAEIVDRLASGRGLEGCAGCTVRLEDGRIHQNSARALRPVTGFRAHDYGLIDVERYYRLKGKRQLDFITSQGCNFRCAFCSDPFVYGRKWVGLDPASIGARLDELWQRYRFDDLNFQDETFFTRRDRVQAMAGHIVESGLKFTWAATMRADQGVRLPADAWERCRQSGLRRLLVGVESGSDEMLKRIRKDITIDQVFHTAQKMRDHGIAGIFPFIVGFPDESDDSIATTLDVAKRLRAMSPDFTTPIFYFKPYPGSEIVKEAVARGYRLPDTLEAWATFDYVDGEPGPWVSSEKFQLIERFKFFHELAWERSSSPRALLRGLARYRCRRDDYRWPVEMRLLRWFRTEPRLS